MPLSQDEIKSELKELMKRPENSVCCDCDDKRPTWASLIVPPPGAPFKETIGCFCCYQCSGAHRRMGTHICFVRSTNLDECKLRIGSFCCAIDIQHSMWSDSFTNMMATCIHREGEGARFNETGR